MNMPDSQRLPPQNFLTQVQGEVSADAPPDRLSSSPSKSAAGESVLFATPAPLNHSAPHWNMTIARSASRFKTHSASGIEAV
jgi:hypothetical protein